jgi:hypothetical protein
VPRDPEGTASRLVQIYDGGAMASSPDHFYYTHPVEVGGTETEGGSGSTSADTANTIVVDVLGHAPTVGDILVAYAVGSRWVAERGGSSGGGGITCSPCTLPTTDLTLSWVNPIYGDGSVPIVYNGDPSSPAWANTGCSGALGELVFQLACVDGSLNLKVVYFTGGACPTGTTSFCQTGGSSGHQLTLASYTCSPLSVTFDSTLSSCPALTNNGYTQFVVTL